MKLLARSSRAYLLRHPWQLALALLGIALGVAVVTAVDLTVASARRAFTLSTQSITGRATHEVEGGSQGIDESVFGRLRAAGITASAPVVDGYVRAESSGTTLQVLGIDPFSEAPFRQFTGPEKRQGVDLTRLIIEPGAVVVSDSTVARAHAGLGDTLWILAAGIRKPVHVVGILSPQDEFSRRALDNLLIADIASAQELLSSVGRLSRIELVVRDSAMLQRIRTLLPAGTQLVRSTTRVQQTVELTRAFDLNLTALSLLTLLFGMFLIYNSVTFSVVQRIPLITTLRTLGVTRTEIFRTILVEFILLGATGTVVGFLLGVLLGSRLIHLVTRTINDLYFVVTVRSLSIGAPSIVKALMLGIIGTAIAATPGALEATQASPRIAALRSVLEARARRLSLPLVYAGIVCAALGAMLLVALPRNLTASLAAIFIIILGAAMLVPAAVILMSMAVRPIAGAIAGLPGRMAASALSRSLSRTAPAIAALAIAIAVGIAVGAMISSFRNSVVAWLGQTLQADVYVSPRGGFASNRSDTPMDPQVARDALATPGIANATIYRNVVVPAPEGRVRLVAAQFAPQHGRSFRFRSQLRGGAFAGFKTGDVLASEPFAYRHNVDVGDSISLVTDHGSRKVRISGVFYDYASEQGVLFMDRSHYMQLWNDSTISSLSLFAQSGVSVDTLIARVRDGTSGRQQLLIRSNRALRDASLQVFDRTFAVTAVLRTIAVIVAFIGVLGALLALQLEREREIGMLRATGVTPVQVRVLVITETSLMGIAAGLIAIPLGALLSYLMIHIVNKRSFGWTLQLDISNAVILQGLALAIVAALLAGIYPAYRMSKILPAVALRSE